MVREMLLASPIPPPLDAGLHISYLTKPLHLLFSLPSHFESLDASQPWILYWITHALALLKHPVSEETEDRIIDALGLCQSEKGGYAGGFGQLPHLATTYAAVNALVTLGTDTAMQLTDRFYFF